MQEALPAAVSPSLRKELLRCALRLLRALLSLCCQSLCHHMCKRGPGGSLQSHKPGTDPILAGAPQGRVLLLTGGCVAAAEQCLEPTAQRPRRAPASPAVLQQSAGTPPPSHLPRAPVPTWWSRPQGCPATAAAAPQAQSRPQTPSRPAGAIELQEAAGRKTSLRAGGAAGRAGEVWP